MFAAFENIFRCCLLFLFSLVSYSVYCHLIYYFVLPCGDRVIADMLLAERERNVANMLNVLDKT